jgi:integrase
VEEVRKQLFREAAPLGTAGAAEAKVPAQHGIDAVNSTLRELQTALSRHPIGKTPVNTVVWKAIQLPTRRRHMRAIRALMNADEELWDLPLDRALIEWTSRLKARHRWMWTSALTYAVSLQGAMTQVGVYAPWLAKINLGLSSQWSLYMKGLSMKTKQSRSHHPPPITLDLLKRVIQAEADPKIRAILAILWPLCGRLGDILKLHTGDILQQGTSLRVTFYRGKTIARVGPLTVFTLMDPLLANALRDYCALPSTGPFLFGTTTDQERRQTHQQVRIALQTMNPEFGVRSIRRGGIQALAAAKVADATIMEFSGHQSVATLRRYLVWNTRNLAAKERGETAAAAALVSHAGTTI